MVIRLIVLSFVALFLVTGCLLNSPKNNVEEAHISDEAAKIERERASLPPPAKEPIRNIVPGKGNCAPQALKGETITACCNNKPCLGHCVASSKGTVQCDCYGTKGGCGKGLVCCKFRRACVPADECVGP
ncbi:MAG: hypothetical protein OES26_23775 [Gammaproteobacteria bacterium]|nr:hypothetical protein [Gammaproteobacteria bacterium]